jgi:hypothetical protein
MCVKGDRTAFREVTHGRRNTSKETVAKGLDRNLVHIDINHFSCNFCIDINHFSL